MTQTSLHKHFTQCPVEYTLRIYQGHAVDAQVHFLSCSGMFSSPYPNVLGQHQNVACWGRQRCDLAASLKQSVQDR